MNCDVRMEKRGDKMLDIEKIGKEIVEKLRPLEPEKIILFGSYAYGTPDEESDIDLYLVKNLPPQKIRAYKLQLHRALRDLMKRYRIAFDFIVSDRATLENREDYFYREEIRKKGIVVYE